MPRIGPIKRDSLIRYLRKLGFDGPYSGGKHQFMVKNTTTITVPNQSEIGKEFLVRVLRQAGIDRKEWDKL